MKKKQAVKLEKECNSAQSDSLKFAFHVLQFKLLVPVF